MAAHQNDTVFPEPDLFEEDPEEEEEDLDSDVDPTATSVTTVTVTPQPPQQTPQQPPIEDSRKLFQRLWTDEDEIELLQGFLEYTTQRYKSSLGSSSSVHYDTSLFYDQIKSKLQLEFNKSQLVEKLRRLKKKYRNAVSRMGSGKDFCFKSNHDRVTFELSEKIWSANIERNNKISGGGNDDDNDTKSTVNVDDDGGGGGKDFNGVEEKMLRSRKRSRVQNSNNVTSCEEGNLTGMVEETVRSCLSPVIKEVLSGVRGIGGMGMSPSGFGFGGGRGLVNLGMSSSGFGLGGGVNLGMNPLGCGMGGGVGLENGGMSGEAAVDERLRKQKILELEVYSKRLELVQEEVKAAIEALRSMGV